MIIENHFKRTKELISKLSMDEIANWLLNEGYFPEQNILPPSFKVENFVLKESPYLDISDPNIEKLISLKYPKSELTDRIFSIQSPVHYHDIVFRITKEWGKIMKILFNEDLKIYSYSFPIPVDKKAITFTFGKKTPLRSGRLIYEWITMAEKDIITEAYKYNFIIRSDITNFYNSIYTHSISWAIHGDISKCLKDVRDKKFKLLGNKIDKIIQCGNTRRTNGIPIGSALSDLIAEIILSKIDFNVSKKLKKIKFLATRFKDDYRFLCNSKEDATIILKTLGEELSKFNLLINENKTKILTLPNGLYRDHDREYYYYSLKDKKEIKFKEFQLTLLTVLDIHKKFGGSSIIEKFLGELVNKKHKLKLIFSKDSKKREKEIYITFSLLILLKRESEKTLCYVLSIIELIFNQYKLEYQLKDKIKEIIQSEIKKVNEEKSIFQLTWYVFFSKYLGLGIENSWLEKNIDKDLIQNEFLSSCINSKQKIYSLYKIKLFRTPKSCRDMSLSERLAVFSKET